MEPLGWILLSCDSILTENEIRDMNTEGEER